MNDLIDRYENNGKFYAKNRGSVLFLWLNVHGSGLQRVIILFSYFSSPKYVVDILNIKQNGLLSG